MDTKKLEKCRKLLSLFITSFDDENISDKTLRFWLVNKWIPEVREILKDLEKKDV